jgi:type IV fimbrial biogenesis protein FimT
LQLRANVGSLRVDPRQGTITPTGSIDLAGLGSDTLALRHVVNIMGRTRRCTPAATLAGVPRC